MKNKFGNKTARSLRIIGEDGPTSVFIVGTSNSKRTLKKNINKFL